MTDYATNNLTGKSMLVRQTDFLITDPLVIEVVYADYFTELRMNDGIVTLSLATSIADGNNRPELRIVSRLRMPLSTLANIQAGLDRILQQAAKAKETAN